MRHGVTVRTERDQIMSGVDPVIRTELRYGNDVVDVDKAAAIFTKDLAKIEIADEAAVA